MKKLILENVRVESFTLGARQDAGGTVAGNARICRDGATHLRDRPRGIICRGAGLVPSLTSSAADPRACETHSQTVSPTHSVCADGSHSGARCVCVVSQ